MTPLPSQASQYIPCCRLMRQRYRGRLTKALSTGVEYTWPFKAATMVASCSLAPSKLETILYPEREIISRTISAAASTPSPAPASAELVARYSHVAVFRSAYGWTPERGQKLKEFADRELARNARYSFLGALKLPRQLKEHVETIDAQLREFFSRAPESKKKAVFIGRKRYFCSEFVAQCFIEAGLIDASGQVFFRPHIQSPGALGKDWVYGVLVGYISYRADYLDPADDEFLGDARYHEIFSEEQH